MIMCKLCVNFSTVKFDNGNQILTVFTFQYEITEVIVTESKNNFFGM